MLRCICICCVSVWMVVLVAAFRFFFNGCGRIAVIIKGCVWGCRGVYILGYRSFSGIEPFAVYPCKGLYLDMRGFVFSAITCSSIGSFLVIE